MAKIGNLLLFIAIFLAENIVSFVVFVHNQSAGIYPVEADSIGIPIIEGAICSGIILAVLIVAIFIPLRTKFAMVLSTVLFIIGGAISALSSLSWFFPDHYAIAAIYAFGVFCCVWLIIRNVRLVASNQQDGADRDKQAVRVKF